MENEMIIKQIPDNERVPHDNQIIIESVNDAISLVNELNKATTWSLKRKIKNPSFIWYRGQGDDQWELIPHIFRKFEKEGKTKKFHESSIFNHFKWCTYGERRDCKTTFEWLCLMQHYGLPTRMLDWTESILVALYFAVCDKTNKNDGTIFCIYTPLLNYYSGPRQDERISYNIRMPEDPVVALRTGMVWKEEKTTLFFNNDFKNCDAIGPIYEAIFKEAELYLNQKNDALSKDAQYFLDSLNKPVAVSPYRTSRRMVAQFSMTTLQGGKLYLDHPNKPIDKNLFDPPKYLESLNSEVDMPFLKAYKVIGNRKSSIKKDLETLGIHLATLFPELDTTSKYVKDLWLV